MTSAAAVEVRFFNGGFCRQLLALVDRRTWRWGRFHAVFLAVQHPREGWLLVDSGYGGRFRAATRRWPYRAYRFATPVTDGAGATATLRAHGIDPAAVRTVIVTHFHADHIGGLRDFPSAQFIYRADALAPLLALRPAAQTHAGFLPELLPPDLASRSRALEPVDFAPDPAMGFPTHDVFGDGAVLLVSLPGHAPGQVGVQLREPGGPLLYSADAYWHFRQLDAGAEPMLPARVFIHDWPAYRTTVAQLRRLRAAGARLLACHCPETQRRIAAHAR